MANWDRFSEGGGLLDLSGRLIVVDTSASPEVTEVAGQVTAALAGLRR